MFAATVGRSLRSLTLWLLERGNTVGLLDRLVGSTSVGSTIVTNTVHLPRTLTTGAIVVCLVVHWTLSPVGSQAALRIVAFQSELENSHLERNVLNTSYFRIPQRARVLAPNAMLTAALADPFANKRLPQDIWGHVKIPFFWNLTSSPSLPYGWFDVLETDYNDYSALVGLPVGKIPANVTTSSNISVQSWYWNLNCDQWLNTTSSTDPNNLDNFRAWEAQFGKKYESSIHGNNSAIIIYLESNSPNRTKDFCNVDDSLAAVIYCPGLPARTISFSIGSHDGGFIYSQCRITSNYVETEIVCSPETCRARRMRLSRAERIPPSNWTILDLTYLSFNRGNSHPTDLFFTNLANAIPTITDNFSGANILAGYISDPVRLIGDDYSLANMPIWDVANKNIDARLSQVLNTYYITSLSSQMTLGGYGDNFDGFLPGGYPYSLTFTATATVATAQERLFCDTMWLGLFSLASLVPLCTSVIGLVLVRDLRGPRLGLNVSSMVRDSPYVAMTHGGSYMDDDKRSELAQNIVVMLCDTAADRDIGHVAVAAIDGQGRLYSRLRKGRKYD